LEVEIQGLDLGEQHTYETAIADINAATKAAMPAE
jgi:hypothetical protein